MPAKEPKEISPSEPGRVAGTASSEPDELSFWIGGHWDPSYRVVWKQPALIYSAGKGPYKISPELPFTPTAEQWRNFWRTLERIGVWTWGPDYYQPVLDGTSWELKLRRGDRSLSSSGSNAYPGSDTSDPSREFEAFLRALSRLVGRRRIE